MRLRTIIIVALLLPPSVLSLLLIPSVWSMVFPPKTPEEVSQEWTDWIFGEENPPDDVAELIQGLSQETNIRLLRLGCEHKNWDSVITEKREATHEIFVKPGAWAKWDPVLRKGFAGWACVCVFDEAPTTIRDGETGRELATYDPRRGYRKASPRPWWSIF